MYIKRYQRVSGDYCIVMDFHGKVPLGNGRGTDYSDDEDGWPCESRAQGKAQLLELLEPQDPKMLCLAYVIETQTRSLRFMQALGVHDLYPDGIQYRKYYHRMFVFSDTVSAWIKACQSFEGSKVCQKRKV